MTRYLVPILLALAACAGVEAGNASITVEVEGESVQTDSRRITREAMRACDNALKPPGVNVTVKFADGDTDRILIDCDDGELHREPAR
jgi:hypothetical protein